MKLLYSPVFILCCVLFVLHQVAQKIMKVSMPFADSYLDNILATPILLTLVVVERRLLFKRGADYTLTPMEITMATLFIILVSEFLFPFLSSDFTFDWVDILCYTLGSILFYFTINRKKAVTD